MPLIYPISCLAGASGSWHTVFSAVMAVNDALGSQPYTLRTAFGTDALTNPGGTPSQIRITVEGHSVTGQTFANWFVDNSDVTDASDANYNATPTRITWSGGSSSVTVGAGATVLSDNIPFVWNTAKGLCFGWDINSGTGTVRRKVSVTTAKTYIKAGVQEASTAGAVSGYTWWNSATETDMIKLIEIFS